MDWEVDSAGRIVAQGKRAKYQADRLPGGGYRLWACTGGPSEWQVLDWDPTFTLKEVKQVAAQFDG